MHRSSEAIYVDISALSTPDPPNAEAEHNIPDNSLSNSSSGSSQADDLAPPTAASSKASTPLPVPQFWLTTLATPAPVSLLHLPWT